MDLSVWNTMELPVVLGALRRVAAANGSVSPAEQALLQTIAQLHGAAALDLDGLPAITPEQVAAAIADPHRRKRAVQLALVTAMVDGAVTPAQQLEVAALARALAVNEQGVEVLGKVANQHLGLARFHMARRGLGKFFARAYDEEGMRGLRKMLSVVTGGGEDPELAWRYRELGLLPEGTLGRVYWEHCTRRHFAFPGEKGGIPERMVFHDFGHVLADYDTTPEGEIQQGAFQAGFIRNDGFVFLLFVIMQFHLGIKLTPVAEGYRGLFDPQKVLRAVERGAACRVDLSDGWSPWDVVARPIAQVRAEYGIQPLSNP